MSILRLGLLCLIALQGFGLHAKKIARDYTMLKEVAMPCGVVALVGTTVWAIIERCKKNTVGTNLEQEKRLHDADRKQLNDYKDGITQADRDQKFLSNLAVYVKKMETAHSKEFELLRNYTREGSRDADFVRHFIDIVVSQSGAHVAHVGSAIERDLKEAISNEQQLAMKCCEWNEDSSDNYESQIQTLSKSLKEIVSLLQIAHSVISEQKPYMNLMALYGDLNHKYTQEKNLKDCSQGFESKLDKHIRSLYSRSNELFCYLAYAESIKHDSAKLDGALKRLASFDAVPFQVQLIERSQNLLKALQSILGFVVTTWEYKKEKTDKPAYDENQERLRMELRERQARIDQENRLSEAKLQAERNRDAQLANDRAEIQRGIKQIQQKKIEAKLGLMRIRDQINMKEALKKNNKEWKKKFDRLQSGLKEIDDSVKKLQSFTNRPPCNPDSVDGLRIYINELLNSLNGIHNEIRCTLDAF